MWDQPLAGHDLKKKTLAIDTEDTSTLSYIEL